MFDIPIASGVPNNLQQHSGIVPISEGEVPTTADAVAMYTGEVGRFGNDPLGSRPDLIKSREDYFLLSHPSFDVLFSNVVTGSGIQFRHAVMDFIRVTNSLKIMV